MALRAFGIVSLAILFGSVWFGSFAIDLAHPGLAEWARRPAVVDRIDDA